MASARLERIGCMVCLENFPNVRKFKSHMRGVDHPKKMAEIFPKGKCKHLGFFCNINVMEYLATHKPDRPILGLSMVTVCPSSELRILFYLCHLCEETCTQANIMGHFFSAAHLINYYTYTDPDRLCFSWIPGVNMMNALRPAAIEQVKKNGNGVLQVLDLPQDLFNVVRRLPYAAAMATFEENDKLASQLKASVPERMSLQSYAADPARKHILLGLQHLVECTCEGKPAKRFHLCTLCQITLSRNSIICHVISFDHVYRYINTWHPSTLRSKQCYTSEYVPLFKTTMCHYAQQAKERSRPDSSVKQLTVTAKVFRSLGGSYSKALDTLEAISVKRSGRTLIPTVQPGEPLGGPTQTSWKLRCQNCKMDFNLSTFIKHVNHWDHATELRNMFGSAVEGDDQIAGIPHLELIRFIKQTEEPVVGVPFIVVCVCFKAKSTPLHLCFACLKCFSDADVWKHMCSQSHALYTVLQQRVPFAWGYEMDKRVLGQLALEKQQANGERVLRVFDIPYCVFSKLKSTFFDFTQGEELRAVQHHLTHGVHLEPKQNSEYPLLGQDFVVRYNVTHGPDSSKDWRFLCLLCGRNLGRKESAPHVLSHEHVKNFLEKAHCGSLDCSDVSRETLLDLAEQAAKIHPVSEIQTIQINEPRLESTEYLKAVQILQTVKWRQSNSELIPVLEAGKRLFPTETLQEVAQGHVEDGTPTDSEKLTAESGESAASGRRHGASPTPPRPGPPEIQPDPPTETTGAPAGEMKVAKEEANPVTPNATSKGDVKPAPDTNAGPARTIKDEPNMRSEEEAEPSEVAPAPTGTPANVKRQPSPQPLPPAPAPSPIKLEPSDSGWPSPAASPKREPESGGDKAGARVKTECASTQTQPRKFKEESDAGVAEKRKADRSSDREVGSKRRRLCPGGAETEARTEPSGGQPTGTEGDHGKATEKALLKDGEPTGAQTGEGLDAVFECHCEAYAPIYLCNCCLVKIPEKTIVVHITGVEHRKAYLKLPTPNVKRWQRAMRRAAVKHEEKAGYGEAQVFELTAEMYHKVVKQNYDSALKTVLAFQNTLQRSPPAPQARRPSQPSTSVGPPPAPTAASLPRGAGNAPCMAPPAKGQPTEGKAKGSGADVTFQTAAPKTGIIPAEQLLPSPPAGIISTASSRSSPRSHARVTFATPLVASPKSAPSAAAAAASTPASVSRGLNAVNQTANAAPVVDDFTPASALKPAATSLAPPSSQPSATASKPPVTPLKCPPAAAIAWMAPRRQHDPSAAHKYTALALPAAGPLISKAPGELATAAAATSAEPGLVSTSPTTPVYGLPAFPPSHTAVADPSKVKSSSKSQPIVGTGHLVAVICEKSRQYYCLLCSVRLKNKDHMTSSSHRSKYLKFRFFDWNMDGDSEMDQKKMLKMVTHLAEIEKEQGIEIEKVEVNRESYNQLATVSEEEAIAKVEELRESQRHSSTRTSEAEGPKCVSGPHGASRSADAVHPRKGPSEQVQSCLVPNPPGHKRSAQGAPNVETPMAPASKMDLNKNNGHREEVAPHLAAKTHSQAADKPLAEAHGTSPRSARTPAPSLSTTTTTAAPGQGRGGVGEPEAKDPPSIQVSPETAGIVEIVDSEPMEEAATCKEEDGHNKLPHPIAAGLPITRALPPSLPSGAWEEPGARVPQQHPAPPPPRETPKEPPMEPSPRRLPGRPTAEPDGASSANSRHNGGDASGTVAQTQESKGEKIFGPSLLSTFLTFYCNAEPIIGLTFVFECRGLCEETFYLCGSCRKKFPIKLICEHIVSTEHQLNYMLQDYPQFMSWWDQDFPPEMKERLLKDIAWRISERELNDKMDAQVVLLRKDCYDYIRQAPFIQALDTLQNISREKKLKHLFRYHKQLGPQTSDAPAAREPRSADTCKEPDARETEAPPGPLYSLLQDTGSSGPTLPVLGIWAIVECSCEGQIPFYLCVACGNRLSRGLLLPHVKGHRHLQAYLSARYPWRFGGGPSDDEGGAYPAKLLQQARELEEQNPEEPSTMQRIALPPEEFSRIVTMTFDQALSRLKTVCRDQRRSELRTCVTSKPRPANKCPPEVESAAPDRAKRQRLSGPPATDRVTWTPLESPGEPRLPVERAHLTDGEEKVVGEAGEPLWPDEHGTAAATVAVAAAATTATLSNCPPSSNLDPNPGRPPVLSTPPVPVVESPGSSSRTRPAEHGAQSPSKGSAQAAAAPPLICLTREPTKGAVPGAHKPIGTGDSIPVNNTAATETFTDAAVGSNDETKRSSKPVAPKMSGKKPAVHRDTGSKAAQSIQQCRQEDLPKYTLYYPVQLVPSSVSYAHHQRSAGSVAGPVSHIGVITGVPNPSNPTQAESTANPGPPLPREHLAFRGYLNLEQTRAAANHTAMRVPLPTEPSSEIVSHPLGSTGTLAANLSALTCGGRSTGTQSYSHTHAITQETPGSVGQLYHTTTPPYLVGGYGHYYYHHPTAPSMVVGRAMHNPPPYSANINPGAVGTPRGGPPHPSLRQQQPVFGDCLWPNQRPSVVMATAPPSYWSVVHKTVASSYAGAGAGFSVRAAGSSKRTPRACTYGNNIVVSQPGQAADPDAPRVLGVPGLPAATSAPAAGDVTSEGDP